MLFTRKRITLVIVGCIGITIVLLRFAPFTVISWNSSTALDGRTRTTKLRYPSDCYFCAGNFVELRIVDSRGLLEYEETYRTLSEYLSGVVRGRKTVKYDGQGRKIETIYFEPSLGLDCRVTIEYNDSGKVWRAKTFDSVDRLTEIETTTYNPDLSIAEWESVDFKHGETVTYRFHMENDHVVVRRVFVNGQLHGEDREECPPTQPFGGYLCDEYEDFHRERL